jgi:hypothetical protein
LLWASYRDDAESDLPRAGWQTPPTTWAQRRQGSQLERKPAMVQTRAAGADPNAALLAGETR